MACLQTKRAQWSFRLNEQLRTATSAYFVTLTYSDEYVNDLYQPSVNKRDVQLFIKKLRKKSKGKIRYYLVSEYGSQTFRPHYHAIMFDIHPDRQTATNMIEETWELGMICVGSVTPASIHYVTKYAITKTDLPQTYGDYEVEKNFALISKGIGKSYLQRCGSYHESNIDRAYTTSENGIQGSLPRYYAEKLYSKAEREMIAENARKRAKTPEDLYPGESNPFKHHSDVKSYFSDQVKKTTKSKSI